MSHNQSSNENGDGPMPDPPKDDAQGEQGKSSGGGRFKLSPEKIEKKRASQATPTQPDRPERSAAKPSPSSSETTEEKKGGTPSPGGKKGKLQGIDVWQAIVFGAILVSVLLWAYWPSLVEMVGAWEHEPDYSHGYLVIPLALFLLWIRRNRFPGFARHLSWWGLVPILLAGGIRYCTAIYRMDSLDIWTLPLIIGGAVWFLFGRRVLAWALPGILFLFFMFPLPYSIERLLRIPLQEAATVISTWMLQLLGEAAIANNNIILLGTHRLGVEEACSGIRIFVSIAALAYFFIVLLRRPWWQKAILALATLPIALITNSLRIVLTGLAVQYLSPEWSHAAHDWIGQWFSPPVAALLFLGLVFYLSLIFRRREVAGTEELSLRKAIQH